MTLAHPKPTKRKKKKRGHCFSTKTIKEIFERDKYQCIAPGCVESREVFLAAHHCLWHTQERIHDYIKANQANKGATLCTVHHLAVHSGSKELDIYCHEYIKQWRE